MADLINQKLRIVSRLAIAGLIIFELLNALGILHFTLDFTWLGLSITAIISWLVIEIASRALKKSCGKTIAGWALLVVTGAIYLDALGDIFHFYGKFEWYDQLAHLAGGAAVAILTFNILWQMSQCEKIRISPWNIGFFTIAIATLFGALYEIEEYLEDYFTGSHRLGSGFDTANDLMLDILGAITIVSIISLIYNFTKKRKNS